MLVGVGSVFEFAVGAEGTPVAIAMRQCLIGVKADRVDTMNRKFLSNSSPPAAKQIHPVTPTQAIV